jgi:hypothetical protein
MLLGTPWSRTISLKNKITNVSCIINFMTWNEVCHFLKPINNYKDSIPTLFWPRFLWYKQRGIQAMWLSPRLCFPTSYAFITYTLRIIFFILGQYKYSCNTSKVLTTPKCPHQLAPMCFTYKQFTYRTLWNTQTTLFKQISIKSIELPKSQSFTSIVNISKITIILVQFFYVFKS